MMTKESPARVISDAINRLGHWEEQTAKELANDHPTAKNICQWSR
jgi:hypothetical protein